MNLKPSDALNRQLLAEAKAFWELAPWRWMYEVEMFGVVQPETGAIAYCTVSGSDQASPGLTLYRGAEGLHFFEQLFEADEDPNRVATHRQHCLELRYVRKKELLPQERALLQAVPHAFPSDAGLWPVFRDYSPGMVPWPLETDSDRQFLIYGLQQARELCRRMETESDLLDHAEDTNSYILVRQPVYDEKGHLQWQDTWQAPAAYEPSPPAVTFNQLFLRSNCDPLPRLDQAWIVELFYLPQSVRDGEERPYFPHMLLVVNNQNQVIIGHALFRRGELEQQLQAAFVEVVREQGGLPSRLRVAHEEGYLLWEPLAQTLQLPLEQVNNLNLLQDIKNSLFGTASGEG